MERVECPCIASGCGQKHNIAEYVFTKGDVFFARLYCPQCREKRRNQGGE